MWSNPRTLQVCTPKVGTICLCLWHVDMKPAGKVQDLTSPSSFIDGVTSKSEAVATFRIPFSDNINCDAHGRTMEHIAHRLNLALSNDFATSFSDRTALFMCT